MNVGRASKCCRHVTRATADACRTTVVLSVPNDRPTKMDRSVRYPVAVVVGVVAAGLVTVESSDPELLAAVFAVYAASTAVLLQYRPLYRASTGPSVPAGVFGGGATAGGVVLGSASEGFGLGAALLGLGLATFGLAMGYWMADDGGTVPAGEPASRRE